MPNTAMLLHDVHFKLSTNKAARNKFAKELAPDFSIFDYLRNDELGISRCIADLLNPGGTHAQVFLTQFDMWVDWRPATFLGMHLCWDVLHCDLGCHWDAAEFWFWALP